jgi:hypothetical protein
LTDKQWEDAAERAGICVNYFSQPLWSHKFRVPGSVNLRHGCVVEGWDNPAYSDPHVQYMSDNPEIYHTIPELQPILPQNVVPLPRRRNPFESFIPRVQEMLENLNIPFQIDFRKLAGLLARNAGFLMRNECHINQPYWSRELEISQPTVSRLIRFLKETGVLECVCHDYHPAAFAVGKPFSKTYAAGKVLRTIIGLSVPALRPPEFDWDQVGSAKGMLSCIRWAARLGYNDHQILEFLQTCQEGRARQHLRSKGDMRGAIRRYRDYIKKHADDGDESISVAV